MTNTFKGNQLIHIPVTVTPEDMNYRYPEPDTGKQGSWWTENPIFSYNAMLMSAYHSIGRFESKDGQTARERFGVRDDVLIFGDSGGFQVLQASNGDLDAPNIKEVLSPINVLRWQESCCDIGMTLDIPLPRTGAVPGMPEKGYTPDLYEKRLQESADNAIKMLTNRDKEAKHFKLFNCIHGNDYKDMMRWYDVTTREGEFDGFSLATSTDMKDLLALRLGFAMEHSVGKPFHLLGISSPQALALIAYANRKYLKTQIYYDSSAASTGRMIRKYMLLWDMMSNGITMGEESPRYDTMREWEIESFGCPCPACSALREMSDLWTKKTISGILITIHNLFWMTYYTKFINWYVCCDDEFIPYVRRITRAPVEEDANGCVPTKDSKSWVIRYMAFLDRVNDVGLEKAANELFDGNTQTVGEWMDKPGIVSEIPVMNLVRTEDQTHTPAHDYSDVDNIKLDIQQSTRMIEPTKIIDNSEPAKIKFELQDTDVWL
ncbi:MAG: hypothetical protein WC346_02745 [Methanogenium sp.]|jgi:tRNA-guanine family transglycosylase